MSYIRSGSNPEGLYVTGDIDGVHWWWNEKGEHREIVLSYRLFEELCHRYDEYPCGMEDEEDGIIVVSRKGQTAKLYETWIPDEAHANDAEDERLPEWMRQVGRKRLVTVLEVDGIKCPMWNITWDYIVDSCLEKSRKRWWFCRLLWTLHFCLTDLLRTLEEVIHGPRHRKEGEE